MSAVLHLCIGVYLCSLNVLLGFTSHVHVRSRLFVVTWGTVIELRSSSIFHFLCSNMKGADKISVTFCKIYARFVSTSFFSLEIYVYSLLKICLIS